MAISFLFKRGHYWHLQYFDEEENRIKRISTKSKNKSDALKFLLNFKNNLSAKLRLKFITLTQFKSQYLDYVKANLSKAYYHHVKITFDDLISQLGDPPLNKIGSYDLDKFISDKYLKSKFSAQHSYWNLMSAFNKAIAWGYLSANPISKLKAPKVPKNNPRFINKSELQFILDEVSNDVLKKLYILAFNTGMRLSEIIFLTWDNVSLLDKLIKVTNTIEFTTKGYKERSIPINQTVLSILKELELTRTNCKYVFNKNGRRCNSDSISKQFKEALKNAALKHTINTSICFHDLRHSFASNLAQKGVSLLFLKELLGHKNIDSTLIYAHLQIDGLREAVELL